MGEASDISVVLVVLIESGIVWHLESAFPETSRQARRFHEVGPPARLKLVDPGVFLSIVPSIARVLSPGRLDLLIQTEYQCLRVTRFQLRDGSDVLTSQLEDHCELFPGVSYLQLLETESDRMPLGVGHQSW